MNNVVKKIFDQYAIFIEEINKQLYTDLFSKNSYLYDNNDNQYTQQKYMLIEDHINLNINENTYNFKIFDTNLYKRISLTTDWIEEKSKLHLILKLNDDIPNKLYIAYISIFNAKHINDDIMYHFEMTPNDQISFNIFSKEQNHEITFNNLARKKMAEKNNMDYVYCDQIIPILKQFMTLFNLYEFEEERISEFLLTGKNFSSEERDKFKLLYDIDINHLSDSNTLSIDLLNKQKKTLKLKV